MASTRRTLGAVFDSSPNALNLLRLALALEVLLWHSFALRGGHTSAGWSGLWSDLGVDGFFAVSGLLITRSWMRRPEAGHFLLARARRILPGLWVSLAVTAAVIVPAGALAAGGGVPSWADRLGWAVENARLGSAWAIGDSTSGLAVNAWSGSLWTLKWEVLCYLLVLGLGIARLVRPRVVVALLIAVWAFNVILELLGLGMLPAGTPESVFMPQRALLMFLSGAALWMVRDRVPLDGRLAAACAAAVPAGVILFDNYRLVAGPALAYLLVFGAMNLGRLPVLRLRDDVSYGVYLYAFPVQQALLLAGAGVLGYGGFTVASLVVTVPLAWLSWRLVERPVTRVRLRVPASHPARLRARVETSS